MALDRDPFQARLLPREKVLWQGRPEKGLFLSGRDFSLIILPLVIMTMGTNVLLNENYNPQGFLFQNLFRIVWFTLGLFPIVARLVLEPLLRRGTRYAVTNKRILIERMRPFTSFTSLNLETLPNIQMTGGPTVGTLRFGPPLTFFNRQQKYFANSMPTLDDVPQFLAIAEPDKILALINANSE